MSHLIKYLISRSGESTPSTTSCMCTAPASRGSATPWCASTTPASPPANQSTRPPCRPGCLKTRPMRFQKKCLTTNFTSLQRRRFSTRRSRRVDVHHRRLQPRYHFCVCVFRMEDACKQFDLMSVLY